MKKFGKIFVFLFLISFLLVGCDGLVKTTFRPLETVSTDLSVWEFYKKIEDSYANVRTDFKNISDKSPTLYKELFDVYDNQKNISRILRDSMAVLDLFYSSHSQAIFEYEKLLNYNVVKDETIARNGYRVSYGEYLDWHNVLGGESEVDAFMAKLILPMQVETKISTNTSGGYTLDMTQSALWPANATEIAGKIPTDYNDTQGNQIKYVYTHETTSTYFTAKIVKQRLGSEDELQFSYQREIRIEKINNINFLTSKVTFTDGTVNEKKFRLNQSIQGISLGYSSINGKLDWIINYLGQGQLRIDGEAYFQGTSKLVIKEKYDLVTAIPSPYSFKSSFTVEHNIDGLTYKMKYFPGQIVYIPLADMNILKVGTYDNEIIAVTMQKSFQNPTIQYYG